MESNDRPKPADPIEEALLEASRSDEDRAVARGIRLEAERIVSLILGADASRDEVAEAAAALRSDVLELFPDKGDLFDAIYRARFRRLWQQFRPGEREL